MSFPYFILCHSSELVIPGRNVVVGNNWKTQKKPNECCAIIQIGVVDAAYNEYQ
jgi:hypothetical protein